MSKVTSRELSREIRQRMGGVVPEKAWGRYRNTKYNKWKEWELWILCEMPPDSKTWQSIPAYTLDELLSVLPKVIEIEGEIWGFTMTHIMVMYKSITPNSCMYLHHINIRNTDTDLTEAAGLLVKWCGQNGHLPSKEVVDEG